MTFNIVLDNDLPSTVTEYAAILDLEIKTEDKKYQTQYDSLIEANNNDELLSELLDSSKFFLSNFSDKSFEPTFNLYLYILNLLSTSDNIEEQLKIVVKNLDVNQSTTIDTTSLISALSNIFNLLTPSSLLRFTILSHIVDLISKNNLLGTIEPLASNLSIWLNKIELPIEDYSSIVTKVFNQFYIENELNALNFFKNIAKETSLNTAAFENFTIKSLSSNSYVDLFDLSLDSKIKDSSLLELYNYYKELKFNEYSSSIENFRPKFTSLNFSNLSFKFKYLLITRFLNENTSEEFTYKQISDAIKIDELQIEELLIDCIHQGLISGRLSQSSETFYLNNITYTKALSTEDWTKVSEYLGDWSSKITELQSLIEGLIVKKGKRVSPPQVIQTFHQQKQELKEKQLQLQQQQLQHKQQQQQQQQLEQQQEADDSSEEKNHDNDGLVVEEI